MAKFWDVVNKANKSLPFSMLEKYPSVDKNISSDTQGGNIKQSSPIIPQSTENSNQNQVSQLDPSSIFNLAILEMFQDLQKNVDNTELYKRQRELARKSIGTISAETPANLTSLSPSQQSSLRSQESQMYEPEIDAISAELKSRDARLQNFESILGQAREMGQDLVKVRVTPEIIEGYRNMIRSGGDITAIPDEVRSEILSKLTTDDWKSQSQAKATEKASGNEPPTSYQEWNLAGGLEGTGKTYAQFISGGGKQLPAGTVTTLSEGLQIPLVTKGLEDLIKNNSDLFGPIKGWLGGVSPYNEEAQKAQADLKRAAQVIGKYMEGGVLRKEDETKYEQMLPKLTDIPSVAFDKLTKVKQLLKDKSNQYISDLELGGFDTSGFNNKLPGLEQTADDNLKQKVINMGFDYDGMKLQGYSDEEIKQAIGL